MKDPSPAGLTRPLRTLVVEDEWLARDYLVELLEASGLAEVVGAVPGLGEARQALQLGPPGLGVDAVFVDVALGGDSDETGLDLVRASAHDAHRPMFVLTTAFKEHAVEAFDLGVDDYLLKPFTEERVEQCLRRLHARHRPSPASPLRIVARRGKVLVFLEMAEVWAFEAADRLTAVHTPHGAFDLDLSLSSIEASFGRGLVRVHRNWLVSTAHVKELWRDGADTVVFVGAGIGPDQPGVRVTVARERAQSVREMLLATATGLRRS
jgi:DNA-binding LytR/AlgR family response regulator